MGSACCIAARDTTLSNTNENGEFLRTSIRYSPTWSLGWDNYRRVVGEIENSSCQSCERISTDIRVEMKDGIGPGRGHISCRSSPLENIGSPLSQKSHSYEGVTTNFLSPSETSMASNRFVKMDTIEQPEDTTVPSNLSFSAIPSSSSFSTPGEHLYLPSRRSQRSPGHQLHRQISDSRILGSKSQNSNSLSEGTLSFMPSDLSNEAADGSSSQRARWSFDSDRYGLSSRFSYSPSRDLQTCGACLKLMGDFSMVAVLACGHVYHVECLETVTTEAYIYDPICPVCSVGEKQALKMSRKALKAEAELRLKFQKISRNRVMDSYLDNEFDKLERRKIVRKGKFPNMEPSSSSKISFAKPFLKRHFPLGLKRNKSNTGNESSKKGFWARYR